MDGTPAIDLEAVYARRRRFELGYAWWSVLGTFLGTVAAAVIAVIQRGVEPFFVVMSVLMLFATGFGVSAGLHRHFSHYSYGAKRPFRVVLAILGIASAEGYFIRWIFDHRIHHRFTDVPGDPHSPYFYGERALSGWRGLLHAHFGWLFRSRPAVEWKLVKDLATDPLMVALDRYSLLIVTGSILLAALAGWIYEPSPLGLFKGALWGGPVRMFLLNHIVWGVNSFGHRFGERVDGVEGQARNNRLFAILAFGDGWHANHHLAPMSARHGWKPSEFDTSWSVLKLLERFGWVYHLRDSSHLLSGSDGKQILKEIKKPI